MKEVRIKVQRRTRRLARVRNKIVGNEIPRLSVFRSNKHLYAQIIDDKKGITLVSASEHHLEDKKSTKMDRAEKLGALIANFASSKKIEKVVFDKGSYKYHGRVKVFADAARKGGLVF